MSSATAGKGTLLKRAGTTVAEVRSISGPTLKSDPLETTNMSSTGNWREFLAGLKAGGEISFEVNFLPAAATHLAVLQDFVDGTASTYTLVWTDSGTSEWSASCFVTSFQASAPVDGVLTASVTLQITGAVTIEGVA